MSGAKLHAIVFDFDGVIADSEPLHLRAYQAVLKDEGIELSRDDYYSQYLGFDDVGLFWKLARDRGLTPDPDKIETLVATKARQMQALLSDGSILFPGAADCIRRCAAERPLAIASGALEHEIEMILRNAGLRDCFKVIASASDGVNGKPRPDLYFLAIAKLKQSCAVNLQSCVAIEDSRWGIDAAQQAGLRCVAITHTFPAAELSAADLVVNSLDEITVARLEQIV